MLAANSHLQLGTRLPPAFNSDSHQFAYAVAINCGERILLKNSLCQIGW